MCGLLVSLGGSSQLFAQTDGHDAAEIRQTAETILASPEFRHLKRLGTDGESNNAGGGPVIRRGSDSSGRGSGAKQGRRGAGQTGESGSSATSSDGSGKETGSERRGFTLPAGIEGVSTVLGLILHAFAWMALVAVCGLILFLVVRALQKGDRPLSNAESSDDPRRQGDAEPDHAPGQVPADVYVTRARQLAGEGRYREAVGQLLLGAMSRIERAGWIRFRRSLTPRDYVRAVRSQPEAYQSLRSIVRVYEPIGFGRRPANRELFEHSLAQYETGFEPENFETRNTKSETNSKSE